MKLSSITCLFAILLSAPCWAQDIKQPVWRFPDPVPVIDYEKTFPKQYEHRIIPEAELERWLNEGWEFVAMYTITGLLFPDQPWRQEHGPINKVIIRRAK